MFFAVADFLNFTVGNILTITSVVSGVIITWQKIKDAQQVMQDKLQEHETKLADLVKDKTIMALNTDRIENYHQRLRKLEAMIEQFVIIANDVKWIKGYMRREEQEEKG